MKTTDMEIELDTKRLTCVYIQACAMIIDKAQGYNDTCTNTLVGKAHDREKTRADTMRSAMHPWLRVISETGIVGES